MSTNDHITIDVLQSSELDIIDGENKLSQYTDEHFMNKLNKELAKIRTEQYSRIRSSYNSNSPIIMSNNNSDSDSDDCFEEGILFDNNYIVSGSQKPPLKKLTFREVRDSIYKYYETEDNYSNELDILSSYLKCQKQMCMKAELITHHKLMICAVPAVIGNVSISIFSPMVMYYSWGGACISVLNAMVFVLYFMIYYFEFLNFLQRYQQLTKQYETLENIMHSTANKFVHIEKTSDKMEFVLTHIQEMEKKIADMKGPLEMTYPFEIKKVVPVSYHINIFAFIKRIEIYKKNLIVKFKDVKNEIRYIQWKWGDTVEQKEKGRLEFICKIKDKIKNEILHYNSAYNAMEELLNKEMKQTDTWNTWIYGRQWDIQRVENPVLKAYLSTIFADD